MATAVKLVAAGPTTLIDVKGVALDGMQVEPRNVKRRITSFPGVNGESHIFLGWAGQSIVIPVLIYDAATYTTAALLSTYIQSSLQRDHLGLLGQLQITSESAHANRDSCTYDGFILFEGPKKDFAGTLGGGYFAMGQLFFRHIGA